MLINKIRFVESITLLNINKMQAGCLRGHKQVTTGIITYVECIVATNTLTVYRIVYPMLYCFFLQVQQVKPRKVSSKGKPVFINPGHITKRSVNRHILLIPDIPVFFYYFLLKDTDTIEYITICSKCYQFIIIDIMCSVNSG